MRLCRNCYVKSWRCHSGDAGKFRRVDPGPALEHMRRLRELGWTWDLMGARSGLGPNTTRAVFYRGSVSYAVAKAVLSLPLERVETDRCLLDPTGTRRRVEALNTLGWPRSELERRMGMGVCALSKILREGRVTPRTNRLVRDLYAELSGAQGPDNRIATRAKALGYQPPMAWEYADIDNPLAKPFQGFREAA